MKRIYYLTLIVFLTVLSGCNPSEISLTPPLPVISEQPEALTEKEIADGKLTPEILWKFGRVGEYDVSADGKTVVYTVTRYSLSQNQGRTTIWRVPVEGGEPVCLTAEVHSSCFSPRLLPSGRIAYLAATPKTIQVWDMNADGTDKRQISFIEGGISGFAPSPKGDMMMYLKDARIQESPREIYPDLPRTFAIISDDLMYRHWDSPTDYAASHIWVAPGTEGIFREGTDIMKGEPYDAPNSPYFDASEIAWSPDGKFIAYTCKKLTGREYALSTNTDIYLYDIAGGTTRNITEGMSGYDRCPVFSPDGSMIAFQSMETPGYESDRERLMVYRLADGKTEDLTEHYDNNAANFVWTDAGRNICFISGVRATYQIYSVNVNTKEIRPVTKGAHDITGMIAAGDRLLVCSKMSMSMAAELFTVDARTGAEKQITFTNRNIYDAVRTGKVEERTVKTTDGKDMLVWVVYPPDFDPSKKYPALLYCQGGPQSTVSQFFSFRWNLQLMSAGGYIVVAPNRRGLPSFGQEWNRQISGDYGGQNMRDYLSAIDDVKKEPYVDENRLGAVGASYGGFSVYWLAGHHEKRFKTFIAHCGMFNFESKYGSTDEYWFPNFDLGGPYWEKPRPKSYDFSPHLSVDKWDTPIMVMHGERDYRVPYTEGLQAFNAARLREIPARLVLFPDEGHWILKPQNAVLWQREFFTWLDRWLK